jgi:hypothetical protein
MSGWQESVLLLVRDSNVVEQESAKFFSSKSVCNMKRWLNKTRSNILLVFSELVTL